MDGTPPMVFWGPTQPAGEIAIGAIWIDTSLSPARTKWCVDNTVSPEAWCSYNQPTSAPLSDFAIQSYACVTVQESYFVPSGFTLYIDALGCLAVI